VKLVPFGKTGLRVSELALGTMTFGTSWGFGADESVSREMLDVYLAAGGNFLDTANVYTDGESELILGNALGGRRDDVVLATKYSLRSSASDPNSLGNHRRNLVRSVQESLTRLQTDRIDLLWIHAWYFESDIEDVVLAMDCLARDGTILYWGLSDTPAWVCAEAHAVARLRGWMPLSAIQLEYSLIERTAERELLPFARYGNLGVAGAIPLGGSLLSAKHVDESGAVADSARQSRVAARRTERVDAIVDTLRSLAAQLEVTPAALAIAWCLAAAPGCVPIVGARTVDQLKQNLDATKLTIPDSIQAQLGEVSNVSLGFPHEMLASARMREVMYGTLPE
jgi:aryl-alcohol dehydrogenase-like predicted oxidoreductase